MLTGVNQMLSTHTTLKIRRPAQSAGFGLVEIMVSLVIGLLATLVIAQVFSLFEGQKRTTTGGADAQTEGSMALYDIKRNMEMAGYGIPVFSADNSPLKNVTCPTLPLFDHDDNGDTPDIDIFPIVIIDGGAGSDIVAIRHGRTQTGGIPTLVSSVAGPKLSLVNLVSDNNMGCEPGDWAVISGPSGCEMAKVSDELKPLSDSARVLAGGIPLKEAPSSTISGGSIACIGAYKKNAPYDYHSSPLEYRYWVDKGQLVQGGDPATSGSGTLVGSGIVNIQAQYGVSAIATSNYITQWVDAKDKWKTPTMDDRNRIKAVRLAVVARSGEWVKDADVTKSCSSITAANPTGLCAWDATSAAPSISSPAPTVDLSAADPDWQHYRYRVFETIIPLRSMIWSK